GMNLGHRTTDPLRDLGAGRRQRVSVLIAAGQKLPDELGPLDELGVGIGAASSLSELAGLARRARQLAARIPRVAHSAQSSPISRRRASLLRVRAVVDSLIHDPR